MKDWQLGYELDELKRLAAPFQALKPHIYGAFGMPKERDVAAALKAGELIWTGKPAEAAAIFKVLSSASTHYDFAGRPVKLPAGSLLVKSVAGTTAGMHKLLAALMARHRGPFWAELFEELPGVHNLARSLSLTYVTSKVAASSEVKGLYAAHEPPAAEVLGAADAATLCCINDSFISAAEQARMRSELAAFGPRWEQHYSSYNKRHSWTAFALCGFDAKDPGFIVKPAEMSKGWKAENPERLKAACGPTTAADSFPYTFKLLAERLPLRHWQGGGWQRVRFMKLRQGDGELTRHADIVDPEAGTNDGQLCRLHLPLQTAPGCRFFAWNHRGKPLERHFHERGLFYLDTRKPHAVRNDSSVERIHLVVDTWSSEALRAALARA